VTLLQFFFIIAWVIILILAIDISKKQKFNALHFLVFLWVGWWLLTFSLFPAVLNDIWWIFGVARWADVLVYVSIIFLLYFVLLLLNKHLQNKEALTWFIRELAIENSWKEKINDKISILIRAYNEEKTIKNVIDSILDKGYKWILVVNDWSTDNTRNIIESYKNIIILNHLKNRWAWAALKTGFEYIKRYKTDKLKYIVTFDADWQHDINDLEKFLKEFQKDKKLDLVLGSRFITKTKTNVPLSRKIILFLARLFTAFVSLVNLTDAHNWYRVVRAKSLDKIEITMDGMEYASEFIDSISKNNLSYKEVPVNIKYSDYSLEKWQKNSNAIKIAVRFIWSKFFR